MENTFDLKKFLVENKLTSNSKLLNENEALTPEKAVDTAEKISDNLSQDPEQLKQALNKAKQAGISMSMVSQVADQLKKGKSPEELLKSISNQVQEELDEVSVADAKKKELWGTMATGAGFGFAAGALALIVTGPTFIPMAILALAGAMIGASFRDKGTGGNYSDNEIRIKAAWEFKNQMLDQGRRNSLPDIKLFYIVDNGDTPKELQGKEIWRFKVADRDAVGDKEALYNSKDTSTDF